MDKVLAKALSIAKKANLGSLSRRQWLKVAAAALAVYFSVFFVNFLVLASQVDSNDARTNGIRRILDGMSLNFNVGSKMLDADLSKNKAIGRVGAYYLTEERFNKLAKSTSLLQKSAGRPIDDRNSRVLTDAILDRMLIEQLVGQYARDNNLEADKQLVELRIAINLKKQGSLEKLQAELRRTYDWSLSDFRYELEYQILRAKMEEALGGEKFADVARKGFQNAKSPKIKEFADTYARNHNNYLISGGLPELAERLKQL